MYQPAPIALFVYNRPEHTLRTLESLSKNELASQSVLFIFSDGAKGDNDSQDVNAVREIVRHTSGFAQVIVKEERQNKGLANSVISGVSEVLEKHPRVIVLEDDLITSKDFLLFMNEALERYQFSEKIFSVSGYSYPLPYLKRYSYSVYFSHRGSSWSWAIWKDRWQEIRWDMPDVSVLLKDKQMQDEWARDAGPDLFPMLKKQIERKRDSWAIRFAYFSFFKGKLHVLAAKNKVNNIGHDNSGTHSPKTSKYSTPLREEVLFSFPDKIEVDQQLKNQLVKFHTKPLLIRLFRKIVPIKK